MAYVSQVKKESVEVIIRTPIEKVEGAVYKLKSERLLDLLNKPTEGFLPVSNAKVFSIESGKLLFEARFLAVNKSHIVHLVDNYTLPEL